MEANRLSDDITERPNNRVRSYSYWISAAVSTILFLIFSATMLTVPGILASTRMWMLSVAGIAVAISLGIGIWRFGSTEAPAMVWPAGTMLSVVLLLELADCLINVFLLATGTHP
jgi:hypothetical protein